MLACCMLLSILGGCSTHESSSTCYWLVGFIAIIPPPHPPASPSIHVPMTHLHGSLVQDHLIFMNFLHYSFKLQNTGEYSSKWNVMECCIDVGYAQWELHVYQIHDRNAFNLYIFMFTFFLFSFCCSRKISIPFASSFSITDSWMCKFPVFSISGSTGSPFGEGCMLPRGTMERFLNKNRPSIDLPALSWSKEARSVLFQRQKKIFIVIDVWHHCCWNVRAYRFNFIRV